jgi:hypothetical protein
VRFVTVPFSNRCSFGWKLPYGPRSAFSPPLSLGSLFYLGARIDALGARMDSRFDALEGRVDSRFTRVHQRYDPLDARLDAHLDRHAG